MDKGHIERRAGKKKSAHKHFSKALELEIQAASTEQSVFWKSIFRNSANEIAKLIGELLPFEKG